MSKSFTEQGFAKHLKNCDNYNDPYNRPLYELFQTDRNHDCSGSTFAKIMYVSRMYKANLELNASWSKNENVHDIDSMAHAIHNGNDCGFLKAIRKQPQTGVSVDSIDLMSNLVASLEQSVRKLFGREKGGRGYWTFCSKYLHFHNNGSIVLFDSNARVTMARTFPDRGYKVNKSERDAAITYSDYLALFFELMGRGYGEGPYTPQQIKNLDWYLVALYRGVQ